MKTKIKCILMVLFLILGAPLAARATLVDSNSIIQDGIEYYIQTDRFAYDVGENVEILYRVTNLTANSIDIGIAPTYLWCDFIITNNNNTDIWQWIRSMPPCRYEEFYLFPYESKEFQITWDMISDNGTFGNHSDDYLIGPDSYHITGYLTALSGYEIVPVSVSIEVIPEPATLLLLCLGGIILKSRK